MIAVWGCLAVYLRSDAPWDGDGAVYTLGALDGSLWERSVHAGVLGPLGLWAQLGLPPSIFGWLWGPVAIVLATVLGGQLLARVPRDPRLPAIEGPIGLAPLIAPGVIFAAEASWRATGTVEVYGPLATLLLGAAVALGAGRGVLAGGLLAWAGTAHPGAWLLLPGVLLLAADDRRTVERAVGVAVALYVAALALLWPDWWSGGRGFLDQAPSDRGPWASLQVAWRLLAGDLGPSAVILLAGAFALPRRERLGLLLLVAGAAVGLDRYSDNPGHLPGLWLAAGAAPLVVRWIDDLGSAPRRTLAGAAVAGLLILGVAEATTRHDAAVRTMDREVAALREGGCDQPDLAWRDAARLELLCRAP